MLLPKGAARPPRSADGTLVTKQTPETIAAKLSPSWPSRDQWAQHRRDTHYKRGFEPFQVSDSLSDYANAAEIEMTISMLKSLWAACGREMRAAQNTVGPLARQPGESGADYHRRWRAMSETDQERAIPTDHLRLDVIASEERSRSCAKVSCRRVTIASLPRRRRSTSL